MAGTATQTPQKCLENKLKEIVEAEPNHRKQEDQGWHLLLNHGSLRRSTQLRDALMRRGLQAWLKEIRRERRKDLQENPPEPQNMRNRGARMQAQGEGARDQRIQRLWDLVRINGKPFRLGTKQDIVEEKAHSKAQRRGLDRKIGFLEVMDERIPEGEVQDHMTADEFRRLWIENYGSRGTEGAGFQTITPTGT